MPKDIPACPGVPTVRGQAKAEEAYEITLLTPLFSGGVEPGTPDPSLPIRPTSVRGQLQFWWRATRGRGCSSRQELFDRHAAVWGRTEEASPVEIEVGKVRTSPPQACAEFAFNPNSRGGRGGYALRWLPPFRNTELPYVLFPFQGQPPARQEPGARPEAEPASCVPQGTFTLKVRFPESLRQDVAAAVWAWVNFGGLGGRTRRGCGALRCDRLAPRNVSDLAGWFSGYARDLSRASAPTREWPTLPGSFLHRPEPGDSVAVWNWLVGLWKHYRQGPDFARNPGTQPNRPGRSRYPEPETIRRLARRRSPRHGRLRDVPDNAFPRAELGLPIVFHFPPGQGEPEDTTLYPVVNGKAEERMASPLILKPLALADGRAIPILVPLRTPGVAAVELQDGRRAALNPTHAEIVRGAALASYPNSPLAGRTPTGSALEAFLTLATAENGFEEVAE